MRDDLLERVPDDDRRQCELCGVDELNAQSLPPYARVEFYNVSCPTDGCDGTASVLRYVVETPPELPSDKTQMGNFRCSEVGCTPDRRFAADAIRGYEPHNTRKYQIPTTKLVNSRILAHHTSYDPEETIDVCYTCHGVIHSDNELYSNVEPDMSRKEAEKKGLLDALQSG